MRPLFLNIGIFLLLAGIAFAESPPVAPPEPNSTALPYEKEVMNIISPLEYSGFHVLVKPEVTLTIDFKERTWTLHNIHQYDDKGNILLEQGRYGLCAELATYLYEKLPENIKNQYELRFAMATEKGFFPTYQSNHIVLLMRDNTNQNTFLMDPSFHKYGRIKDFAEYQILGVQDTLSFVKDKSHDATFDIDQAMPLFIKDDILVSFAVTSVEGKFDKDNFLFLVSVNRRDKFSGLNLLMVGKYNGEIESFEGTDFLQKLLNPHDIEMLHKKILSWLEKF